MNSAKIEEVLYNLDQQMGQKKDSEVKMIYAGVFLALVGISYSLFWDSSEAMFNSATQKVKAVQAKLKADQTYLNNNPESKIATLDNQIKTAQARYSNYQDYNSYIKQKMRKISALYYDEQTWGEYLNSLSKNAKTYNIKLLNLENKFATSDDKFGHVLDISVKITGGYNNVIKYINELEQSFLVVDVHTMEFKADERLTADLKVSVWGITY